MRDNDPFRAAQAAQISLLAEGVAVLVIGAMAVLMASMKGLL